MKKHLGWIVGSAVAAVLLIVLVLVVVFSVLNPSPEGPSSLTTASGRLEKQTVSIPLEEITGWQQIAAGNAGDDYAAALKTFRTNEQEMMRLAAQSGNLAKGSYEPGPSLLKTATKINEQVSDGARKAEMRYTFVHTPKDFRINWFYEPTQELSELIGCLKTLSLYYYGKGQYDQAIDVMENMLAMGRHLMEERARPSVTNLGLSFQRRAVSTLEEYYRKARPDDGAILEKLDTYKYEINKIQGLNDLKRDKVCWDTNPPAGDVYNIIENDEDRAWRVQGLLALGIVKFTREHHRGDNRYTAKLLEKYSTSEDPYLREAALTAKELTKAEFRRLGSQSAF